PWLGDPAGTRHAKTYDISVLDRDEDALQGTDDGGNLVEVAPPGAFRPGVLLGEWRRVQKVVRHLTAMRDPTGGDEHACQGGRVVGECRTDDQRAHVIVQVSSRPLER